MPRRCTICTHKSRAKIDKALVARNPFRTIAGQYQVSKSALVRHHDDHLPAALVKVPDHAGCSPKTLLAEILQLIGRLRPACLPP